MSISTVLCRGVAFASFALLFPLTAQAQSGGVPSDLLSSFKTGVNITRWFCYLPQGGGSIDHFAHYLLPADYLVFKRIHAKFVRLCISPDLIFRDGKPDPPALANLDHAVEQLVSKGLTVVWDLHDNGQLKLDQPGTDLTQFVAFWGSIARHYKGRFEHKMVFELLNEPQFQKTADAWYTLQEQAVKEVRRQDEARTIMVTSASWSDIDTFAAMKPLPQKNLIYTFHCYDPFFFTHQGAEWVGEDPGHFKHVPFPASPEAIAAVLLDNDEKYRNALIEYGKSAYDDAYIESRLAKGMDWGKANHVPVVLGEFGAYPKVSPSESRARWFQATRRAIDRLNVPNAIWGYDDALGLGRSVKADGTLQLDSHVLEHFYGER